MIANSSQPSVEFEQLTFSNELSSLDVNILYSMMISRIAKGYITSEVSFLMGYKDDIIRKYEELESVAGVETLFEFISAIDGDSLNGVIFSDAGYVEGYSSYRIKKTISSRIIEYSMYCTNGPEEHLVFNLYELNPDHIEYPESWNKVLKETRAVLTLMFEGSLFDDPITPLKIYRRCRSAFTSNGLYPRHVQLILEEMTKKKDYPRLKRKYSKATGLVLYVKVFSA